MKRHIPFVLLAFVLCLSGCAGRYDLPTSATEDTPQAARWLTLGQSKKDHRNSIKITVVLWWSEIIQIRTTSASLGASP